MGVIYAEDFQQLNTGSTANMKGTGLYDTALGQSIVAQQLEIEAYGLYPAAAALGTTGDNSRWPTIFYDTIKGALSICQGRSDSLYNGGVSGFRRAISYEGDTLFVGACLELGGSASPTSGNFLLFSVVNNANKFTSADGVGQNLYAVGIDANGMFSFNGVSTTVNVYERPASVKVYIDVVFGPDYMELWINNVMALRQIRNAFPIKEIGLSCFYLTPYNSHNFCIWMHSLIVADNTDGYNQRVGRKVAKTEQVQTTPVIETAMIPASGYVPLAIIRKYATAPTAETNVSMIGSLVSPNPYVKNEFTVKRASSRLKPYGASVNIQAKRLEPSGDGLGLIPYTIIGGTKVLGKVYRTTSQWRMFHSDIPIAPGQTFTDATFGYQHDYKDLNKVFVDDRTKVEVYGDKDSLLTVEGPWWKTTDLVAFDSTLFNSNGFNDFNNKQIISTSRVANTLPFLSDETFKFGPGIDLNTSGALLADAAKGAVMTSPWTIDFWFKESADDLLTAWQLYCYQAVVGNYMMVCPNSPPTTQMAIWNQSQNVAAGAQGWTVWKSKNAWRHSAVVYDGTKLSFFIDGVLQGSITWTILSFSKPFGVSHRGFWGYDVTTSRIKIERYRMRSGVAWVENFDTTTIY